MLDAQQPTRVVSREFQTAERDDQMDLKRFHIEFPCPNCGFYNRATLGQVMTRDVLICRGCKSNVRLEDHMNSARASVSRANKALERLAETMKNLSFTLRI